MYSATEAMEDAVEAFSQSLSVFLLGFLLSIGKDSIDSTLLGSNRENMIHQVPTPCQILNKLSLALNEQIIVPLPPQNCQTVPARL